MQNPSLTAHVSLILMLLVFVMNMVTVLVLTQQYYQVYKLVTSGAHGFDVARSYYLNPNIQKLRYMAVQAFFWALPLYVTAVALMVFARMRDDFPLSHSIVLGFLCFASFLMMWCICTQKAVFWEHYNNAQRYHGDKPLLEGVDHAGQPESPRDTQHFCLA